MKSASQTALKILSIIFIVLNLVFVVAGALILAGALSIPDEMGASFGGALGIMAITWGVIGLIIGLLGVRGANNPAKIGAFWVLCILGIVLYVIEIGLDIFGGTASGSASLSSDVLTLAFIVVMFVLATRIKKQG